MSLRFKFTLLIFGALAVGAIGADVWSLSVGLFISCAALITAALAALFVSQTKRAARPTPLPSSAAWRTTRDRQGAAVADSGALLEAMMDGMREGMLVVDEEMRIVASNRAAREIFSGVSGSLETHRLSELTRNPAIHSAFNASFDSNEQAQTKVELRGLGGPIYDLRVVPLKLRDEQNSRGAMGVFFDITRLERLERVRQEFLSNVSHELRTPLTAIIAFVETLEDGAMEDRESNRRFLSIIRKNAERMHNLIDDILELSAIEAGTVKVEVEPVQLRALVNDVLTALASRAEAREIKLNNEVAIETIVTADARRLEQMLTNLIHNAIKFNRTGGAVFVRSERGERDRICVVDTGDGIPPEHIKRIFERFYRVDRARSREMGGTGLGLAIVKHLARAHGGEVSVQSSPGEGSTFTIELLPGNIQQGEEPPAAQTIEQAEERAMHALRSN